jgi:hypothetical protein
MHVGDLVDVTDAPIRDEDQLAADTAISDVTISWIR